MVRIIFSLLLLAGLLPVAAQGTPTNAQAPEATTDTILVFDASGSMWGQIDGVNKIVIARDVVSNLLKQLPDNHRMGLIAYGHSRKGDCGDIEMLAPVGTDHQSIAQTVQKINPKGMTPMTDSVIKAAEALKFTENKATVILVSDGEETCHANPCDAAKKLDELGVGLTVHTVGFGLESKEAKAAAEQLQCMAAATGGKFLMAHNAEELTTALTTISQTEPQPKAELTPEPEPKAAPTVEVTLTATDQKDGPVIKKGLVWTVYHGITGEEIYQSEPGGSVTTHIPKGIHDVTVTRIDDKASADGELETGAKGTKLTLPIIVTYDAKVSAPDNAMAGDSIRVQWTGPEQQGDYIAIAKPDTNLRWPAEHTKVDSGNPLKIRVPAEPGEYRLVYVMKHGHRALAEQPFTVSPK